MELGTGEDRPLGIFQVLQLHVQHQGLAHGTRLSNRVPPGQIRFFRARQIDRHPLSGVGGRYVFPVNLQIPDAGLEACRQHFRHIPRRQGAFDQGAGDNGAEALHGEYPVNGQAERDPQVFLRCLPH